MFLLLDKSYISFTLHYFLNVCAYSWIFTLSFRWHMRYSSLFLYICPSKWIPLIKSASFSLKKTKQFKSCFWHVAVYLTLASIVWVSSLSFSSLNEEGNNIFNIFFNIMKTWTSLLQHRLQTQLQFSSVSIKFWFAVLFFSQLS